MALREIITKENPTLREKALPVTDFGEDLQALIDDMVETMLAAPGVGLAAPQVADSRRVVVVQLPAEDEEDYGEDAGVLHVVVNPEVAKASRRTEEGTEGCLSVPGYLGTVERPSKVTVRGQDRHGSPFSIRAKGWLARVFQHEIDHLEGVLFTDLASKVWKMQPGEPLEGPEAIEAASA